MELRDIYGDIVIASLLPIHTPHPRCGLQYRHVRVSKLEMKVRGQLAWTALERVFRPRRDVSCGPCMLTAMFAPDTCSSDNGGFLFLDQFAFRRTWYLDSYQRLLEIRTRPGKACRCKDSNDVATRTICPCYCDPHSRTCRSGVLPNWRALLVPSRLDGHSPAVFPRVASIDSVPY